MRNYFNPLSILAISFLGFIVYSNAFNVPFSLDDIPSILGNSSIKNIHNLQNIFDFWPSRFITYLSIALNYHFNGLDVFGYHFLNLIVHVVSAILVWWLTLLTLSTPVMKEEKIARHANVIALFAGLIFVAHPIQTEAVTYIVQRAASMATMFYLTSLCFYVKFRLSEIGEFRTSHKIYYICAFISAILAMFTKEIVITLPLMILFYEFSFFKNRKVLNWRPYIPFLLTLIIIPMTMYFTESVKVQQMRGVLADAPSGITPLHYLLTEFRVIVTYIRLVFIPLNQNVDYEYHLFNNIFELPVFFSLLFLTSILFIAKHLYLKHRIISFSICWFFITLLPESSIFPIRDVIFEHRLYLPMFGYALFLVSCVYYLFTEKNILATKILLILIVAWYAILTYNRNFVWQSEITLWSDVIKKSPGKPRAYFDRAIAYQDKGDLPDAVLDYKKAVSLEPDYAGAFKARSLYFERQGDLDKAILEYTRSIAIAPGEALVYFKRGNDYLLEHKLDQAKLDFIQAARLNPNLVDIHYSLAVLYYFKADYKRAWICLHKAILSGCKIDPKFILDLKKASEN